MFGFSGFDVCLTSPRGIMRVGRILAGTCFGSVRKITFVLPLPPLIKVSKMSIEESG